MLCRLPLALVLLIASTLFGQAYAGNAVAEIKACIQCHTAKQSGFNPAHAFAPENCVACHAGNAASSTEVAGRDALFLAATPSKSKGDTR